MELNIDTPRDNLRASNSADLLSAVSTELAIAPIWQLSTRPNYIYDTTLTRSQNRGYIFSFAREFNWIFAASYIVCAIYTMAIDNLMINLYSLAHMLIIYIYLAFMTSLHFSDLTLPTNPSHIVRIANIYGLPADIDVIQNLTKQSELFWVKVTRILSIYISVSWYIIFVYYVHNTIDLTNYLHLIRGDTLAETSTTYKSLATIYIFSTVFLPIHTFIIYAYIVVYTVNSLLYSYTLLLVTSINTAYILVMWLLLFANYGISLSLLALYTAAYFVLVPLQVLKFIDYRPALQSHDMTDILHIAIVLVNYAGLIILLVYITSAGAR